MSAAVVDDRLGERVADMVAIVDSGERPTAGATPEQAEAAMRAVFARRARSDVRTTRG